MDISRRFAASHYSHCSFTDKVAVFLSPKVLYFGPHQLICLDGEDVYVDGGVPFQVFFYRAPAYSAGLFLTENDEKQDIIEEYWGTSKVKWFYVWSGMVSNYSAKKLSQPGN